jgi:hypothetical protein
MFVRNRTTRCWASEHSAIVQKTCYHICYHVRDVWWNFARTGVTTVITNTENWVGHIIAGILGTIFSLSIVYIKLEQRFSVHQKLNPQDILSIADSQGNELSPQQVDEFVRNFNEATFLGGNTKYIPDFSSGLHVQLKSGVNLYCSHGQKFIEVMRVDKKGRRKYYWLTSKEGANDWLEQIAARTVD